MVGHAVVNLSIGTDLVASHAAADLLAPRIGASLVSRLSSGLGHLHSKDLQRDTLALVLGPHVNTNTSSRRSVRGDDARLDLVSGLAPWPRSPSRLKFDIPFV